MSQYCTKRPTTALRRVFACLALLSLLAFGACDGAKEPPIRLDAMSSPAGPESFAPRLSVDDDGGVLLSWLAARDNGHALRFARYTEGEWSPVRTVAEGTSWFANWADTPGVRPVGEWLFAHWLVRSGPGSYDYDIRVAWSRDGGREWGEPFTLHRDGIRAEHGFLSSVVLPDGDLGLAWLDGRHTRAAGREAANGEVADAMTLRWARLAPGADRTRQGEQVDGRVCDCCMTATVREPAGARVIYRDRSRDEIRDIAYRYPEAGEEGPAGLVARDGWRISACPVNGPAAARVGDRTGVVWFTGAGGEARVQLAWQADGESGFRSPRRLDTGGAVGRVAFAALGQDQALAVWLEASEGGGHWMGRQVTPQSAGEPVPLLAATTGRSSGFPALVNGPDGPIMAWTEFGDGGRSVRTARLRLAEEAD